MLRMRMNPRGARASWGAVVILLALAAKGSAAQDCPHREYAWTNTVGGVYFEDAQGRVVVDGMGRVFIGGEFADKVDFDPTDGKDNRRSRGKSDAYVTCYEASGAYVATRTIGSAEFEGVNALALRPQGGVLLGGNFHARLDFDPSKEGRDRRNPIGTSDAYVSSYDMDLNYLWTWRSAMVASENLYGLTTDQDNNVIMAGAISPNGYNDVLVAKLSASGEEIWTRTFGGDGADDASSVAADHEGNIVVAGRFAAVVDFDPGIGETYRTSNGGYDAFISKFTPEGELIWVKTIGAEREDGARVVKVSPVGEIYLGGLFQGRVDFDPEGSGDVQGSGTAGYRSFVTRYGPNGEYRWTRSFGGIDGYSYAWDLALSDSGRLAVAGGFGGLIDFDPGESVDEKMGFGDRSCYVSYWSQDGDYRMTDVFGGTRFDRVMGLTFAANGDLYVAGDFDSPVVDFDPSSGTEERSAAGYADMFVTKFYCGECAFIDRHDVTKDGFEVTSTVYSTAVGGRVTVVLSNGLSKFKAKRRIGSEGGAQVHFGVVPQGEYICSIRRVEDRNDAPLCVGGIAKRSIVIP